jgi:Zn finger protein HypA/HybF involved in hydrogenase expression
MHISLAKHDRDQNAIESARIHNEEVIPAYHVYQEKIDQFNRALSVSKLAVYENTIPEVYRNEDAINFFITALETLRADSEKELFNLYEEDLHRRKIEQLEQEKLQQLDASLVHCPKCNGTHCRMITSTKTDSTPFGLGDACCGWILFGPIGILCGLCGASSSTETKTYWVCDDCGKKFSDD